MWDTNWLPMFIVWTIETVQMDSLNCWRIACFLCCDTANWHRQKKLYPSTFADQTPPMTVCRMSWPLTCGTHTSLWERTYCLPDNGRIYKCSWLRLKTRLRHFIQTAQQRIPNTSCCLAFFTTCSVHRRAGEAKHIRNASPAQTVCVCVYVCVYNSFFSLFKFAWITCQAAVLFWAHHLSWTHHFCLPFKGLNIHFNSWLAPVSLEENCSIWILH